MIKYLLLLGFSCFSGMAARLCANTITVTSNADSGPGTLREALQTAAANGTAQTDTIVFNIADQTRAGRTIILATELPALTSNLVIDGSTQAGTAIGKSDAKVIVQLNHFLNNITTFRFLHFQQAENIRIYGLFLFNSYYQFAGNGGRNVYGISFALGRNIVIGEPGKGNYIRGCNYAIYSGAGNGIIPSGNGITIQSNVIGNDENGEPTGMYLPGSSLDPVYYGFYLQNHSNILIGGNAGVEGNTIMSRENNITSVNPVNNGFVSIINNKFGAATDGTFDQFNYSSVPTYINILGKNTDVDFEVTFNKNILSGLLSLNRLTKYFIIQGNKMFTYSIAGNIGFKNGIYNCQAGGLIGGEQADEKNEIYGFGFFNSSPYGLTTSNIGSAYNVLTPKLTIRKNIMYCNDYYASSISLNLSNAGSAQVPYVEINTTALNFVAGKATPGCTIDIYLDDSCMACEGKAWLGTTTSQTDSSWSFSGTFSGVIVATATNNQGTTSEFSQPVPMEQAVVVQQPTCGQNNGFIKGMKVAGSTDNVEWRMYFRRNNVTIDSVIATTPDVENLGPGEYFFFAKLGNTCRSYSRYYKLTDVTPSLNFSAATVVQPSCGQFNGSISGIRVTGYTYSTIQWFNEQGQEFQGEFVNGLASIKNLGPGRYFLFVKDTVGGCGNYTPLYTLNSSIGPVVDINNVQIIPASCGNSNGSITNINLSQVANSPFIQWVDSLGRPVGSSIDLMNKPAGKYRMKFKDGSACDTIVTPYFTIPDQVIISIDSSQLMIKPSRCNIADGSITGITVSGAIGVQWVNVNTGVVAGSTADLLNAGPGSYRLIANNPAYGCTVQSGIYNIITPAPDPILVTGATPVMASCNLNNASIHITSINNNPAYFTFHWLQDSSTVVGAGLTLDNLSPGRYQCIATDTNGCQQQVYAITVIMTPLPTIDDSRLQISPDTCNMSAGSIRGISAVSSEPGVQYAWYNAAGQLTGNDPSLLNIPAGDYYMVATDARQCAVSSGKFTVYNVSKAIAAPPYRDVVIPKGVSFTIEPAQAETGIYYLYDAYSTVPVDQNNTGAFSIPALQDDAIYYVARKAGDCISPKTRISIQVVEKAKVVIPNAFTPNGDHRNDTWGIKVIGLIKLHYIRVFNRWGQVVFETADSNRRWDGTFNGRELAAGEYVWMMQATDYFGKPIEQKGVVLLIR